MIDERKPVLEKIGCYFENNKENGFKFFLNEQLFDGTVFVYKRGILWKLKQARGKQK